MNENLRLLLGMIGFLSLIVTAILAILAILVVRNVKKYNRQITVLKKIHFKERKVLEEKITSLEKWVKSLDEKVYTSQKAPELETPGTFPEISFDAEKTVIIPEEEEPSLGTVTDFKKYQEENIQSRKVINLRGINTSIGTTTSEICYETLTQEEIQRRVANALGTSSNVVKVSN